MSLFLAFVSSARLFPLVPSLFYFISTPPIAAVAPCIIDHLLLLLFVSLFLAFLITLGWLLFVFVDPFSRHSNHPHLVGGDEARAKRLVNSCVLF
ncbi:hypothetical protein BDN72DRAFT_849620 [Pluteus cervinus]|uniref:Uncharacterized protein n=1 Tax=Pluteus cervinus TaxID=181527 RepID=A0ACD3A7W1_9AGAR|nr:hypothetical protein BDN72DRAFT_849620 [Pluteus cervinus]